MATLYFNAAVDNDWNNLGNWWDDDTFTAQATSLPTGADSAFISGNCTGNTTGSTPAVSALYVHDCAFFIPITVGDPSALDGVAVFSGTAAIGSYSSPSPLSPYYLRVYGEATFSDEATFGYEPNGGTMVGGIMYCETAVFNEFTYVAYDAFVYSDASNLGGGTTFNDFAGAFGGTVSGDATLNDQAFNSGTFTGDATFNGNSFNGAGGNITGDATFNDSSYNFNGFDGYGTVTGEATFNGISVNYSTVSSNATFNDSSYNNADGTVTGNATFNGNSYNYGVVTGDATFNGDSRNFDGAVYSNATFNDFSCNEYGTVSGNATFTASTYGRNPVGVGGGISGTVTFSASTPVAFTISDAWAVDASPWVFSVAGESWTFNGLGSLDSGVVGDATFNDSASNNYGIVNGDATFNDGSYNNAGTVIGNAVFNGTSVNNNGTVTGNATFSVLTATLQLGGGYYAATHGSVSIIYEKGINGSSILGVI